MKPEGHQKGGEAGEEITNGPCSEGQFRIDGPPGEKERAFQIFVLRGNIWRSMVIIKHWFYVWVLCGMLIWLLQYHWLGFRFLGNSNQMKEEEKELDDVIWCCVVYVDFMLWDSLCISVFSFAIESSVVAREGLVVDVICSQSVRT